MFAASTSRFAASTSRLRESARRCAVLSLKTTTPSLGAAAANAGRVKPPLRTIMTEAA